MTDKQPSRFGVFAMSNTNWGFLMMLTQKRRGKLYQSRETLLYAGNDRL